jgi:hypothetical protein
MNRLRQNLAGRWQVTFFARKTSAMQLEQKSGTEIEGIGLGAVLGIVAGLAFGSALAFLSGGLFTEMGVIVVVHSVLAMAAMGAWVTPSLLSREESEA